MPQSLLSTCLEDCCPLAYLPTCSACPLALKMNILRLRSGRAVHLPPANQDWCPLVSAPTTINACLPPPPSKLTVTNISPLVRYHSLFYGYIFPPRFLDRHISLFCKWIRPHDHEASITQFRAKRDVFEKCLRSSALTWLPRPSLGGQGRASGEPRSKSSRRVLQSLD